MIRTYNHFLFSFEFPEIGETFRCRGSRATHSTVFTLSQPNLISLMFIKIGGTLYITLVSTPFHIARIIYSILGYFSRRKKYCIYNSFPSSASFRCWSENENEKKGLFWFSKGTSGNQIRSTVSRDFRCKYSW